MRVRTALLLILAPGTAAGQVITGTVRADSSLRPIPGVEVLIEGRNRQTTTDDQGRFALSSPSGNQVVLFRLVGYQAVRMRAVVGKRDTVQLDATMVKISAQELPGVEVTERPLPVPGSVMAAFEERRRGGFGKFLDSTEMRKAENRRLPDVLRSLGVRLMSFQSGGGPPEQRAVSSGISLNEGDPCWVAVFLDGVAIYKAGSRSMKPPDFSRDFLTRNLMAIEYYRSSATVPIEFGTGRDTDCGVLVLWTRKGL
jgi:hypothetical protein